MSAQSIPRYHYRPTAEQRAELQAFRERLAQLRAQRQLQVQISAPVDPQVERALHELRRLMGGLAA